MSETVVLWAIAALVSQPGDGEVTVLHPGKARSSAGAASPPSGWPVSVAGRGHGRLTGLCAAICPDPGRLRHD